MTRARSQAGFTVVEVLVASVVLAVVAAGAMTFVQVLLRQSRGVVERTDAMQRGRIALDQMTRSLRSQVCLNEDTEGLIAGNADEVTFYADYSDGTRPPERRTLKYDPTTRRLTETTVAGTGPLTGPISFTSPARTRRLLDGVTRDGSTPVFQYFAYGTGTPRLPNVPLPAPLSTTDLGNAARVQLTFQVGSSRDAKFATRLEDDVLLRNTDPNAARPDPTCR
jgi:prepilin-type N-terminal cleavage/methylation domain-containing protein